MSSIISSLTDLAKSLVEVVWSLFTTAGDLAQKTIEFVLRFFTGALNLVIEFFKGLVDLAGGIVQFVLGKCPFAFSSTDGSVGCADMCGVRQHCDAGHPRGCFLRVLAVPAEPGQYGQGWEQEAELVILREKG